MENKQITVMKARIAEVEKLHNRLTAIVVHLYHDNQKMKKYIQNQESINLSTTAESDEVDKLVIGTNSDSNDRANKILEELKRVQNN